MKLQCDLARQFSSRKQGSEAVNKYSQRGRSQGQDQAAGLRHGGGVAWRALPKVQFQETKVGPIDLAVAVGIAFGARSLSAEVVLERSEVRDVDLAVAVRVSREDAGSGKERHFAGRVEAAGVPIVEAGHREGARGRDSAPVEEEE